MITYDRFRRLVINTVLLERSKQNYSTMTFLLHCSDQRRERAELLENAAVLRFLFECQLRNGANIQNSRTFKQECK